MRFRTPILQAGALAGLLLLAAPRARAFVNYATGEFVSLHTANLLLPHTFPTKPMRAGKLDFKLVPGFLLFDREENDTATDPRVHPLSQSLSGGGAALSLNYTFADTSWGHFGVGFLGVYFRQTGEKLGFIAQNPGLTDIAFTGRQVAEGGIVALTGNWDPISWESWFHLPIVAGASFQMLRDDAHAEGFIAAAYGVPGGQSGTFRSTNELRFNSAGLLAGLSPQVELGKWVRVTPFGMISLPLQRAYIQNRFENLNTGRSFRPFDKSFRKSLIALGVNLTYIPWGIGFTYVPPFRMTEGASAYCVSLSKSFGGPKDR